MDHVLTIVLTATHGKVPEKWSMFSDLLNSTPYGLVLVKVQIGRFWGGGFLIFCRFSEFWGWGVFNIVIFRDPFLDHFWTVSPLETAKKGLKIFSRLRRGREDFDQISMGGF